MSPSEIRALVTETIRDGFTFPGWAYLLALILPLIGAYFGAYTKRKGEDRATREGFDQLREQLRKTIQDTEEIKATLSKRTWLTQQQWAIRERHYLSLLTHLTRLKLSLEDRDLYYNMDPDSEQDEARSQSPHFQELSRVGHESYQAIRALIGPASIFLSRTAIASLEKLVRDHWSISETSSYTAHYVSDTLKLVILAESAIQAEAKNELTPAHVNASEESHVT